MSSTWADLFKKPTNIVENSSPQCLHEISNDWICVDDQQNCETVDDLQKHEFLSEDQKQRRKQWQKRLQKGRSKNYNSLPSKARLRKNSSSPQNVENKENNNNSQVQSLNSQNQNAQLRAKLRLAVEAAGSSASSENNASSFQPKIKPSNQKPSRNQRVNAPRRMPIQQPSQRGMN